MARLAVQNWIYYVEWLMSLLQKMHYVPFKWGFSFWNRPSRKTDHGPVRHFRRSLRWPYPRFYTIRKSSRTESSRNRLSGGWRRLYRARSPMAEFMSKTPDHMKVV